MKGYAIITDLSTIIWTLVAFFYRANKHFFFFLSLAAIEISSYFLVGIFHKSPQSLWLSMHFLMLSCFDKNFSSKHKVTIFAGFSVTLPISFSVSNFLLDYIIFFFHVIFLLLFIRYFVKIYFDKDKFNIFYILMIFYEIFRFSLLFMSFRAFLLKKKL